MKNVKIFVSKKREESHGGVKRDRTADLLNAIQALSQLSYNPKRFGILSFYGLQYFEICILQNKFLSNFWVTLQPLMRE